MSSNNKTITGIIYKTTNLINGKWYIGKDENNNPIYLGSGLLLNRAIKKHGRENFKKEILAEASTRNNLSELEKYFIEITDAVNNPMSYNVAAGGRGGNTMAGFNDEERKEFSNKTKDRWELKSEKEKIEFGKNISRKLTGRKRTLEHCKNLGKSVSKSWTEERKEEKSKEVIAFYETERGEKVKETLREKCKHFGEDNGFFGKTHTQESLDKMSKKKTGSILLKRRCILPEQETELKEKYLSGIALKELTEFYDVKIHNIRTYLKKLLPNTIIYQIYNTKTPGSKF